MMIPNHFTIPSSSHSSSHSTRGTPCHVTSLHLSPGSLPPSIFSSCSSCFSRPPSITRVSLLALILCTLLLQTPTVVDGEPRRCPGGDEVKHKHGERLANSNKDGRIDGQVEKVAEMKPNDSETPTTEGDREMHLDHWMNIKVLHTTGTKGNKERLRRSPDGSSLVFTVVEESEPGSFIGSLAPPSVPSTSQSVRYDLLSSTGPQDSVRLGVTNGELKTGSARLDREQLCTKGMKTCLLELRVMISLKSSANQFVIVQLHLLDINDHEPTFPSATFVSKIMEDAPIGLVVLLPPAVDPDAGINGTIVYQLLTMKPHFTSGFAATSREGSVSPEHSGEREGDVRHTERFTWKEDETTDLNTERKDGSELEKVKTTLESPFSLHVDLEGAPYLQLEHQLDYEEIFAYVGVLKASDGGKPHRENVLLVHINITDANDHAPHFLVSHVQASISESAATGTVVAQVNARDADAGANGAIKYVWASETGAVTQETFYLNMTSGEVSVLCELDREQRAEYQLEVVAMDRGRPRQMATATITVLLSDVNDNVPVIETESLAAAVEQRSDAMGTICLTVSEAISPGTRLLLIQVSDPDLGRNGSVSCRLLNAQTWTNKTFNKLGVNGHHCKRDNEQVKDPQGLSETENGGFKGTAATFPVPLQVYPAFKNSLEMFLLETTTTVDRETQEEYHVWLEVRDGGNPHLASGVWISILLLDENDNAPQFNLTSLNATVMENNLPGAILAQVQAWDPDAGSNGTVRYTLCDAPEYLSLDPVDGYLRASHQLDHNERSQYRLNVTASDGGEPARRTDAILLLHVLDANDHGPVFTRSLYPFALLENRPAGLLGKLTAYDLDSGSNGVLNYSLAGIGNWSLRIDAQSGELHTTCPLDRERDGSRLEFTVIVMDGGRPPLKAESHVVLVVEDENDNFPTLIKPRTDSEWVFVQTLSNRDSEIYTLRAVDPDAGSNGMVTFELTRASRISQATMGSGTCNGSKATTSRHGRQSRDVGRVLFFLGRTDGLLRLARDIMPEDRGLFRLGFRTCDSGWPNARCGPGRWLHVLVNDSDARPTCIQTLVEKSLNNLWKRSNPRDNNTRSDQIKLGAHFAPGLGLALSMLAVAGCMVIAYLCKQRGCTHCRKRVETKPTRRHHERRHGRKGEHHADQTSGFVHCMKNQRMSHDEHMELDGHNKQVFGRESIPDLAGHYHQSNYIMWPTLPTGSVFSLDCNLAHLPLDNTFCSQQELCHLLYRTCLQGT
uniref:protocadherin-7-like isoform X2 n=1 Tax=Myxine glutinosa TaxID=7769 RepID=UPI0035902B22